MLKKSLKTFGMLKKKHMQEVGKVGLKMNEDKFHITDYKEFQYDSEEDPFDFITKDQTVKLLFDDEFIL